jgi:protein-L-isoaspartate O-methyltransferase
MRLLNGRLYENALEIGAAEGIFTQHLAPICTSLLSVEVADAAVAQANERLRGGTNVTFIQATLPRQMPNEQFDFIIASDVRMRPTQPPRSLLQSQAFSIFFVRIRNENKRTLAAACGSLA